MKKLFILLIILFCNSAFGQGISLIEEGGLDNFIQLNGDADYYLEDGILTGISKTGTPNSFLATKVDYSDFILEFDVWIDYGLNSGVQIRSNSSKDYHNGRVYGYQVEIDTSPRRWSGGVYDEFRRAWLYPLSYNESGQSAFQNGTWNHYRIEAFGNSIRTWINGIPCAHLIDEMTDEGFIAFQVHSIGNDKKYEGKKIRWRNIVMYKENIEELLYQNQSAPQLSYLDQELTDEEKRRGWRLLWDGVSLDGWTIDSYVNNVSDIWTIESGVLKLKPDSTSVPNLITIDEYKDFELAIDFYLTKGSNSGIKYYVKKDISNNYTGLEYQLLDNKNHPDGKKGVGGNRTLGSLYDLIAAKNLSEKDNKSIRFKGLNKWNRLRIVSRNGSIQHWLNDIKIVEYDRNTQLMEALLLKSKYASIPNFGLSKRGRIMLQNHGDEVWFKNIKLREF